MNICIVTYCVHLVGMERSEGIVKVLCTRIFSINKLSSDAYH